MQCFVLVLVSVSTTIHHVVTTHVAGVLCEFSCVQGAACIVVTTHVAGVIASEESGTFAPNSPLSVKARATKYMSRGRV